ncbi:MAG TPA: hypothetical protein PK251_12255 [Candidatus Latescibacteria bacterium]|nr:hypothetical protein [Candidatus Latescibacterota bacterium]HPK74648.1 hypothetical protein [Candidatus Latescibacterota bacterium]
MADADNDRGFWKKLTGRGRAEGDRSTQEDKLAAERKKYGMDPELEMAPYESGLTARTLIGALFVAIVMMPASIYLGLVVGTGLGSAAEWVSIILFTELARRSFMPLKRQEIYILFILAGGLVGGGPFGGLIWNTYLQSSQEALSLGVAQRLTTENIWWAVPPAGSEAVALRTFWHRDWLPIVTLMVFTSLISRFQTLSSYYFLFRLTSDVERLPFPFAPIAAQGITALAEGSEGETWRWRWFSIGSMIGLVWGAIYVGVPTVTAGIFGTAIEILPIPFVDFTREIGNVMPGSLLGFNTDLGGIMWGFVVPFPIICGQVISAFLSSFVLPPFLVEAGILKSWRPGLGVVQASVLNNLDLWTSVSLGVGLPIMFLGVYESTKVLMRQRDGRGAGTFAPPPGRGDLPLWLAAAIWFVTSAFFVGLAHWLVPLFPVWIYILFAFVYTPFISYIGARMIGHAGTHVAFPPITQAAFILSGYKGIAVWWVGSQANDFSGGVSKFREIELTKTKFTSYFAVEFIMFPITFILSFAFWSVIWKMNPIPSSAYPFALKMWPLNAYNACLWQTATIQGNSTMLNAIKFDVIGYAAIGGGVLYAIIHFLHASPMWWYGLIGGLGAWPHGIFLSLTGALLSRYYLAKKFGGPEQWFKYAIVLNAGYACGVGLIGMAGVAIALINGAITQSPFQVFR